MACNPPRRASRRARSRTAGFTLIELVTTIVIVAILATIGIANFIQFKRRASVASCTSNQRHTLESSLLYISTSSPGTTSFDVNFLTAGGFLSQEVGECPESTIDDFNDYTVNIVNNSVTLITCRVLPVEHAWTLP